MQPEHEPMLEDTRSLQDGLWRMARLAQDGRIEDEDLDGLEETVEVREALSTFT